MKVKVFKILIVRKVIPRMLTVVKAFGINLINYINIAQLRMENFE